MDRRMGTGAGGTQGREYSTVRSTAQRVCSASSRGFPMRVCEFSVSQGEAREPRFSQIELDPPRCGARGLG